MRFRWSSLRRKSSVGPGLSALIRYYRTFRVTLRGLTGLTLYPCRQTAPAAGDWRGLQLLQVKGKLESFAPFDRFQQSRCSGHHIVAKGRPECDREL